MRDGQKASSAQRIYDGLRQLIASGQVKPGDKLPGVTELMIQYDVRSRAAVDRALRDLENEGLLTRKHGSGIEVRRQRVLHRNLVWHIRLEWAAAMAGQVVDGGLFEKMTGTEPDALEVHDVTYERAPAPARAAELLGVDADADVLLRTLWYRLDGEPLQVARSYIPVDIAERARLRSPADEVVGMGTMAHLHNAGIALDPLVPFIIEARVPTAEETRSLAIPAGTSVLIPWRVLTSCGRPVEVSTSVVRGDRIAYVFQVELEGEEE